MSEFCTYKLYGIEKNLKEEKTNIMSVMKKRIYYFDYLRIFASFAVIFLHVSALNWYDMDVNSFEWQVFNLYDSIVRWGVPVFVMMSGALFIPKSVPTKVLYSKYILRLVIAFFSWSFLYSLTKSGGGIKEHITYMVTGPFYLWFIPMLIGLYMCIPFIKVIVEHEKLVRYFMILAFIFSFLIPNITMLINDFGNVLLVYAASKIKANADALNISMVAGYPFYFILGYLLNEKELTKKHRHIIYFLGVVGFVSTILLDLVVSLKIQKGYGGYYGNMTLNVLFEAMAVFVFFKYNFNKMCRFQNIIIKMSKYSFGVYMVHVIIMDKLSNHGINSLCFNPLLSVPVISIFIMVISYIISGILNNTPLLKKYIV